MSSINRRTNRFVDSIQAVCTCVCTRPLLLLLLGTSIVTNLVRNECETDGLTRAKQAQKFGATPILARPHPLFRHSPRPRPLNLKMYGPKQGSILRLCLCHTPFVQFTWWRIMMSAEGGFGTRAGHIKYFRDCPASFGTVGNYVRGYCPPWNESSYC